jgi:hypothetical protein
VLLTDGPVVPLVYDHYLQGFLVADFNNDFHADVLTWQASDPFTISVFLGDGRGGFAKAPATLASLRLWSVGVGDLNGDGKVDLAFSGYNPFSRSYVIQIMAGIGNGTFRSGAAFTVPDWVASLRISDVNRDGRADVVGVIGGALRTWFGDGSGSLRTGWTPTSAHGRSPALGDVNLDGFLDVVSASTDDVRVSLGSAEGFSPPTLIARPYANWTEVAVADVTMDGRPDIVENSGFVIPGRGDGTFDSAERFAFEGTGLHIADFTRDGLPDLVMATSHGAVDVIASERNSTNHAPAVDAGPDRTFKWTDQPEENATIVAIGTDPDVHWLTYEWRDAAGNPVPSYDRWLSLSGFSHGTHTFTVTARDAHGGMATDSVDVTIVPTKEIVLWTNGGSHAGTWRRVDDATAAGSSRLYDPDAGAPKVTAPSSNPSSRVELLFVADPTQSYKLWVRLKAENDYWGNDSVWVQFTGSADAAGNAAYRYGTSSGLRVSLEECTHCGVSGWGWEDDGWGAIDLNGVTVRFPEGGYQKIVIQTREDGVSIDQVVLSSEKYLTTRPGAAKNDNTIVHPTFWPYR